MCACCETDLSGDVKTYCTSCSEYYEANPHLKPMHSKEIHFTFKTDEPLSFLGQARIDKDIEMIVDAFVDDF